LGSPVDEVTTLGKRLRACEDCKFGASVARPVLQTLQQLSNNPDGVRRGGNAATRVAVATAIDDDDDDDDGGGGGGGGGGDTSFLIRLSRLLIIKY
jgi:hypothetical protein